MSDKNSHFDDYAEESDDFQVNEYDLTASPNDFNIITIFSFMESGAISIPGFQRNYVWDIARASKLIESLILGLPVPQIFLYEQTRNKFLVIDGQQRLMSIYYFIKQRFPKKEKRSELRSVFEKNSKIPDSILNNAEYFKNFDLSLPEKLPNRPNKFKGLNYSTLGDYKTRFDLRPIRNVIVKQNLPKENEKGEKDDSSIYEIFNRLNSGGINLSPQEIRISLYHSEFFEMLNRINADSRWRKLLKVPEPDLHMKDIEIILRGFAMLIDGDKYKPSMTKFLNQFSKKNEKNSNEYNDYLQALFYSFLEAFESLPEDAFLNKKSKRFNLALYETVFTSVCSEPFKNEKKVYDKLDHVKIRSLENDEEFLKTLESGTMQSKNVQTRLKRGKEIIG